MPLFVLGPTTRNFEIVAVFVIYSYVKKKKSPPLVLKQQALIIL